VSAVIQINGLTKFFAGTPAVNKLSLEVPAGAVFALLGDNGAGKSTTIRMLTGLLPPDAGTATILGQDCWTKAIELRHKVGYVPERPKFYDWMTVAEIGGFAAAFHARGFKDRYLALIDRFMVGRSAKLSSLSKGGYAKVGLALALASEPQVLLLDEPTSGLDLFTRREFLNSMVSLAGDGRTILIASHSVAEVERVASHVAFLAQGKLLLAGSLDDLRTRLVTVRVRHGGQGFDPSGLGQVLDVEESGRDWRGVVLDPPAGSLGEMRHVPGVASMEASVPTLEEMYTALLARFHRPLSAGQAAKLEGVPT
jgi:ABC-2 type transport system ATP-binding protein